MRSPETVVHLVTLLEEMPVQETLDAAAELRGLGLEVGGVVVNAVRRRRCCASPTCARSAPVASTSTRCARTLRAAGRARPGTHGDRAARGGAPTTPSASPWRSASASGSTSSATRRYELPRHVSTEVDLGALLRAGRRRCAGRAWHERPAAGARRRRAARRPRHAHHRVLRLRRRRQDHDGGGAGAARGRAGARASSCSPSTRPGAWRSRWASTELDNDPRRGRRDRRASAGRLARRDDARHEAHVRRGRRGARRARTRAAAILANPFYQSLSSSFAGTQEYMAMEKLGQLRARPRRGHLGPDRRRHPAEPLGAGLPRRAAPARLVPRRTVHPDARRRRPAPAVAALPTVHRRRRRHGRRGAANVSRRPAARRRPDVRRRRSTRCSAGSASGPSATYRAAAGRRARRSSSSPPPSATRCARPRTSSSGWPTESMPLAGLVLNRVRPCRSAPWLTAATGAGGGSGRRATTAGAPGCCAARRAGCERAAHDSAPAPSGSPRLTRTVRGGRGAGPGRRRARPRRAAAHRRSARRRQ